MCKINLNEKISNVCQQYLNAVQQRQAEDDDIERQIRALEEKRRQLSKRYGFSSCKEIIENFANVLAAELPKYELKVSGPYDVDGKVILSAELKQPETGVCSSNAEQSKSIMFIPDYQEEQEPYRLVNFNLRARRLVSNQEAENSGAESTFIDTPLPEDMTVKGLIALLD